MILTFMAETKTIVLVAVIVAVTIGIISGMMLLTEFTITQGLSHSAHAFKYCNGGHGHHKNRFLCSFPFSPVGG
jgi:hypothetical protein